MGAFLIPEPRCVFLHVHKTGGASIRRGFFKGDIQGPANGYVPAEWKDLFIFGFVRHPLDRLVSAWKMFAIGMENTSWENADDVHGISLREFLDIAQDETIPYDGERKTTKEKIRHHTVPQSAPFYSLAEADFVGRFERYREDFQIVLDRIGLPPGEIERLPHMNSTQRRSDYMHYFDPETLEIARSVYAEDFLRFGYS